MLEDRTLLTAPVLLAEFATGTTNIGSQPREFVTIGDRTFFAAGGTLWSTDGTANGATAVMSFGLIEHLTNVNGVLYFSASDRDQGMEIWKSDGTTAGTMMVADLEPGFWGTGPAITGPGVHVVVAPYSLTSFQNRLYFVGDDGVSGSELWSSDGTLEGTQLVKDIRPGIDNSDIAWMTTINGVLYFAANDGTSGAELWKSDGTAAGTVRITDISPGSAGASISQIVGLNGAIYFSGSSPGAGAELWKTDGTTGGTALVMDITSGTASSSPLNLVVHQGVLYFTANTASGRELWKTNGTTSGTAMVADIAPGSVSSSPVALHSAADALYFSATDGVLGRELWKTDGTTGGTSRVHDIAPGVADSTPQNLVALNGFIYFTASDGVSGRELWKTDGTAVGTSLVADINPGAANANVTASFVRGNRLLFQADDGVRGAELWSSDGTTAGTSLLQDLSGPLGDSSAPFVVDVVNGITYFVASTPATGRELWATNGTPGGHYLLRDFAAGTADSFILEMIEFQGLAYFAVRTAAGCTLWRSDGTATGTTLVTTITTDTTEYPSQFTISGNKLFFVAKDSRGRELWVTDGTASGTRALDIWGGAPGSLPSQLFDFNGVLLFEASDAIGNGRGELWKSDGTSAGTVKVKELYAGVYGGGPQSFALFNGHAYFFAIDGTSPAYSLWRTDGTSAGTVKIDGIPGASGQSFAPTLTAVGNRLFLQGYDALYGREVWTSTGNPGGLVPVRDLYFGSAGSNPWDFIEAGGFLYFTANDGRTGRELWKLDPATLQVSLVKDLFPGLAGSNSTTSNPTTLVDVDGTLYFAAFDGLTSSLWKTDGTEAGTVRVSELEAAGLRDFQNLRYHEGRLIFTASTAATGRELWAWEVGGVSMDIGLSSISVPENQGGSLVGTLSTTDPASTGPYSYSLAAGPGAADNSQFLISGNQLIASVALDFEAKSVYSVRIRTTNGLGDTFEKIFQIQATDVNEAPSVSLSGVTTSLPENTSTPRVVATIVVNDDALGTNTLSLSGADAAAFEIIGSSLRLKSGVALNYEARPSYTVRVNVNDPTVGGTPDAFVDYVLNLTDVNELPSHVNTSGFTLVAENSSTSNLVVVTSIEIFDDALGTNNITLSGADAAHFQLLGTVVRFLPGTVLDYETKPSYAFTINIDDPTLGGPVDFPVTWDVSVVNVNEAPTGVALTAATTTLPENAATPREVATIVITDDALGTNNLSLSGPDAGAFEIVGNKLRLRSAVSLNYEARSSYSVRVNVNDPNVGGNPDAFVDYVLTVTDVNELPTHVNTGGFTLFAENTSTTNLVVVTSIAIFDDALGTNNITLSGPDAAFFQLVGNTVRFVPGTVLDYETKPTYAFTINIDDPTLGGLVDFDVDWNLSITDVNEAPTGVALTAVTTTVPENTATPLEVATIVIADDALGTNSLVLTGVDANAFEIVGNKLRLRASVALDYESRSSYSVRVNVNDPAVGGTPDAFIDYTLTLTDISENTWRILDNGDAGYSTTGNWTGWSQDGHAGDLQWSHASTGAATASWSFTGLTPGQYRVSSTWLAGSNRATNATYSIRSATGAPLGSALVNQQLAPDDLMDQGSAWEHLGIVSITSPLFFVQLSNVGADQYIIADAIRIERIGDVFVGPEITVLEGATDIASGVSTVDFGTATVGQPLVKTFTIQNTGTQNLVLQPAVAPAGFTITTNFTAGQIVVPGATATLNVRLDAAVVGSVSGALSFATNDSSENPFQFTVSGGVTSPSLVQIIDNGDAGYLATGAWTSWGQDGHGSDLQWSHSSTGLATATWSFTGLTPGEYRVSSTWLAAPNRATNASYSMKSATGMPLGSALINQQHTPNDFSDQGSAWEDLGIVTITGTTLVVELTNVGADQYIIADAIRIERGPFSPPAVQIVDNGDAGYSTTGAWTSWGQDGRGSDLQWSHNSTGPATATWSFTSLIPGKYRVSTTWLAASNRATNASYFFRSAIGGSALGSAIINQQSAPDDFSDQGSAWENLSIVTVTGSSLVVELTNAGADHYIIADAIRIERIGD